MIPESFLEKWRLHAEWQTLAMVEQDLVISRALVCLYNHPFISERFILRGGTALNKLFFKSTARYSEDIDLVQKNPEPIGSTIDYIREILQSWLGEPKRKITERSAKLVYQYQAIGGLVSKLKIEINISEHFQVLPLRHEPFSVQSDWYSGQGKIITYELEELLATKLRALFQRRKGRDLFDLWYAIQNTDVNVQQAIDIFIKYCNHEEIIISKELFLKNVELKKMNRDFRMDMSVLLPHRIQWNFEDALNLVMERIIKRIP